uniref:uncharacterized protein LOC120346164 n=1 Tax=Styela clava TaxID=7725 RepID=UPI00193AD8E7|nr:uncharacterized protein LOC120346164 [Styela clava]
MMDFTKTKKLLLTAICMLLVNHVPKISAQEVDVVTGVEESPLPPPTEVSQALYPFGRTLTQDTAIVMWIGPEEATAYDVVILKAENKELILHEEIDNVHDERVKFEDLDPSTHYEVIVRSVRVILNGTTDRSVESKPYRFRTLDPCKGGMIHTPCNAHCIASCEKQKPICDRRCVSGCACPRENPFLHNGKCITKKDCNTAGAPVTEVLSRPEDLKVHRMKDSNDVLFTWSAVEGADFYTVTVTLRNGEVVKKIDNIKIPFVIIPGLKPKTPYRFKVVAKYIKFSGARTIGIGPMPTPNPPTITQVSENSFYVSWLEFPMAKSYKVVLYDPENDGEMIRVFKDMTETFVTIQGLSSGTTYDVSIIAVTLIGTEPESPKSTVKTMGEKTSEEEINELDYEIIPIVTTTVATTTTKPLIPSCEERRSALEAFYETHQGEKEPMPDCAKDGKYKAMQCPKRCYCVDRTTGTKFPGTDFDDEKAAHALDCHKYGRWDIELNDVTASAVDTKTIRVKWQKNQQAKFYIVKVYEGFSSALVKFVTGITRATTPIDGLKRGQSYVVTVIAVNAEGVSSTDKVRGEFVVMPYLDPPKIVKLSQLNDSKMKATWEKNGEALHYRVEIFGNGDKKPLLTYENVTEDNVIFDIVGRDTYRVRVTSTGVTTIPGSGREIAVSSNHAETMRRPSCIASPIDIIYVLDGTSKVNSQDFLQMKEFFVELTKSLGPIGTDMSDTEGTRVAVVRTAESSRAIFRYHKFNTMTNLIGAIRFVRQTRSGRLNVGKMLEYIHQWFFESVNNDDQRKDVNTAVVTFMGGASDEKNFAKIGAELRGKTNVISVGIENRIGDYDMTMASPKNMRVKIPTYNDIDEAVDRVMEILCNLK